MQFDETRRRAGVVAVADARQAGQVHGLKLNKRAIGGLHDGRLVVAEFDVAAGGIELLGFQPSQAQLPEQVLAFFIGKTTRGRHPVGGFQAGVNPGHQLVNVLLFSWLKRVEFWFFIVQIPILGVVEIGGKTVKIGVADGVVGVAVALHAGHRCALPHFPGGADAVDDGGVAIFLVVGAAFVVGHRVAVKSRGNQLVFSGRFAVAIFQ